jgi:hypothetical protein
MMRIRTKQQTGSFAGMARFFVLLAFLAYLNLAFHTQFHIFVLQDYTNTTTVELGAEFSEPDGPAEHPHAFHAGEDACPHSEQHEDSDEECYMLLLSKYQAQLLDTPVPLSYPPDLPRQHYTAYTPAHSAVITCYAPSRAPPA